MLNTHSVSTLLQQPQLRHISHYNNLKLTLLKTYLAIKSNKSSYPALKLGQLLLSEWTHNLS